MAVVANAGDKTQTCYGCPDRFPGCHGSCEFGLARDAENAARRVKQRQEALRRNAGLEFHEKCLRRGKYL